MRSPAKLRNFLEIHFPHLTSFALETRRPGEDGRLQAFRVEQSWPQGDCETAEACAETITAAAQEFVEECPGRPFRALVRVPKDISTDGRIRCDFQLPGGGEMNPYPIQIDKLVPADDERSMAIVNFVLGHAKAEADRTDAQLEASRGREDALFTAVTGLVEETRKDRKMFLEETRKDRASHDERMKPILDTSIETLKAAAELVKIHNESNTQVQLAKLQYESEKERMEMYFSALPYVKDLLGKVRKKKRKQLAETPEEVEEDMGPRARLFKILDALTEQQLADAKRIIGAKHFDALYNSALGESDLETTKALQAFMLAQATKTMREPEAAEKSKNDLHALLGDSLSKQFVALLMGDEESDEEPEGTEEPDPPAELVQPGGWVEGLRNLKLNALTEDQQVGLAEQLGPSMAGVLVGAAESLDEKKAFLALGTLGSRLNELAKELGDEEAEKRFDKVLEILEDDQQLVDLMARAVEKVEDE